MQIRRSLWITFAFSNANTIALFAVSLVLARILTPQEIGVFSLCTIVVNMTAVLRDLGTTQYVVRKGDVTAADTDAVLGLTLTTSWSLALALWLGRHHIAAYFNEPLMVEVLPIMLIGFLIIPVAGLMTSLLIRSLSAGRSALVSMIGSVAYATVLLGLALAGYGAKSPAWANSANLVATVICLWFVMPKGFRLRPRWSGWGAPVRFGGGVVLSNMATVCTQSLPEAAIGRGMGAHDVGLYSRANGTVGLFQQVVGPTLAYNALPIIANAFHQGPEVFRETLKRSSELMTAVAWPIYIWIAIFPTEIISLLYGATWLDAAHLVPWLALAAGICAPLFITGPALQAANQPFIAGAASLASLVTRGLVVLIFGVKDLHQFVIMLFMADMAALMGWIFVSWKYLGVGAKAVFLAQRKSLLVGASCLCAALLARIFLADRSLLPIVPVTISGACILGAWLASLHLSGHPLAGELQKIRAKLKGESAE